MWQGELCPLQKKLWGLEPEVTVSEHLLCPSQSTIGHIRLFQFDPDTVPVGQQSIRKDARTWDSGGIFDLDVRVPDVHASCERLLQLGWHLFGGPVDWPFGELDVREALLRGPDDVVLAIMQRLAPPLPEFDKLEGFSQVFNSSQTVRNMRQAVEWYQQLGFRMVVEHFGPLGGRGGEVLGLTREQAPGTPVQLVIMQPHGETSGSVELVHVEGMEGSDYSEQARPWNLGLNLLRFPVNDLEAWLKHLEPHDIHPENTGIIETRLEPFGPCRLAALRSPDGAWLEFYQAL